MFAQTVRKRMPKIFISYRREDSEHITGRIDDRLAAQFGRAAVFIDVDTIPFGIDFRVHLQEAVAHCDFLLAVIGESWIEVRYQDGPRAGQRRLDDPGDFVRVEIQSALQRGIVVIPVLVGRGAMPSVQQLPEGLQELAYRNAAEVRSGRDFHDHMDRLIRGIENLARQEELQREQAQQMRLEQAKLDEVRQRQEAEARLQEDLQRRREREEAERRQREADDMCRRQAEKEEQKRELARLQREGEEKLAQLVHHILNRTGGKPTAADNNELRQLRRDFQLSSEHAKPIIAAAQSQWTAERKRELEEEALRLREQARLQREIAEQRTAERKREQEEEALRLRELARRQSELAEQFRQNLLRLKADGRLLGWVESHLSGWDHRDWIALLVELKESGFWPQPLAELRLLINSMQAVRTAACLAHAGARMRSGEPGGLPSPLLALPICGIWYSREHGQHGHEWQYEASLPGLVNTSEGREYLLGIAPEAADADLAALNGLQAVAELRALHLAWCEHITDAGLKHVNHLVQLQSLEVTMAERVTDAGLAQLGELTLLQSLVLHRCYNVQDSSLPLLAPLRSLESLTLWGCRHITDVGAEALASFGQLRSLGLWGCQKMTDKGLTSLTALPWLNSLTIYHCPEITVAGIAKLCALTSLRQLNVYRCCQVVTPDVRQLQAAMPQCKITIISAMQNETAALRRRRLSLSYPGRIASLNWPSSRLSPDPREMASNGPTVQEPRLSIETSQAQSIVPTPGAEPASSPAKKWWEVWK
jgi:hypothetical protein